MEWFVHFRIISILFLFREELVLGDCDEEMKQKILNYAEDSGDEKIVEIVTEKPIEFDCESILSKLITFFIIFIIIWFFNGPLWFTFYLCGCDICKLWFIKLQCQSQFLFQRTKKNYQTILENKVGLLGRVHS